MSLEQKLSVAKQWIQESETVLFITGAGISAESGLPTYRGMGGLYNGELTEDGYRIEEILSGEIFTQNPQLTWKYLKHLETHSSQAKPNAAHQALSELERRTTVWIATQNIDSFHRDAGSHNLIEIHGNLHDMRCTSCEYTRRVGDFSEFDDLPRCPRCQEVLRPDIVLFGEMLPQAAMVRYQRVLETPPDLIVSVGTSAMFPYIAGPIVHPPQGSRTIDINPESHDLTPYVDLHLDCTACEALPIIAAA